MPSLSLIAIEAERLLRPLKEPYRGEVQEALIALCESHWQVLRGPQPESVIEGALWSITPAWSDLLLDLFAAGDPRLMVLLPGSNLSMGLALVVLAEIDRGNEAGVHLAHEPMMAFESALPPVSWLEKIASLLRGTLTPPLLHRHDHHDSLWKAVALIAAHTRRLDLAALMKVISLVVEGEEQADKVSDGGLETLRRKLSEVGIQLIGVDAEYVYFEQHRHAHNPARVRRLGEILLDIRKKWLR